MSPRTTLRDPSWQRRPSLAAVVVGTALVTALLLGEGLTPVRVAAADPSPTPTPTAEPSPTPTPTPTPAPTRPYTPTSTLRPTRAYPPVATIVPVATPAPTPTPSPTPTPTPTGPTAIGATVTFYGRGWGHGVGLSQYGSRGRALAGQTATEILAHYYQGATWGTLATDTQIRVRILKGFTATTGAPLILYGRGGTWTIDGVTTTFPVDAKVTVTPTTSGSTTTWRIKVTNSGGTVLRDAATTGFRMRPGAAASFLQVWSRPSSYDTYRGVIRVRLDTTGPTLNVINELPLESYLRGVVPAEMPSSWPAEALRAQTIAARSYAARHLRPTESYYDVNADTSSQVYLGIETEKASTDAAISGTAGVVLKSGSTIANTLFSSTAGGATENNENVFVSSTGAKVAGPVSYLRGSPDRAPDGTPYDASSPYATWSTKSYTKAQLSAWFAADSRTNVGTLTSIDLRDRGVSGRLISVTLVGSAGTKKVSGDIFRSVFNAGRPADDPSMRSTLVDTAPVP